MKALLFAAVVSLAACSSHAKSDAVRVSDRDAAQLLIDRNWLDVMPTSKHDRLHVYRFVPQMGGGVFQDRTLFKGTFELFKFRVAGDHIQFDLPETEQLVDSPFQIETVSGPAPFDLKLTIKDDPRGAHEYFGIRAENDHAELNEFVALPIQPVAR